MLAGLIYVAMVDSILPPRTEIVPSASLKTNGGTTISIREDGTMVSDDPEALKGWTLETNAPRLP